MITNYCISLCPSRPTVPASAVYRPLPRYSSLKLPVSALELLASCLHSSQLANQPVRVAMRVLSRRKLHAKSQLCGGPAAAAAAAQTSALDDALRDCSGGSLLMMLL